METSKNWFSKRRMLLLSWWMS